MLPGHLHKSARLWAQVAVLMAAMSAAVYATGWGFALGIGYVFVLGDAIRRSGSDAGLPVIIDLIDVNGSTGRFHPPSADELNIFRDALTAELGMPVVRRYSGGQDIDGGCGMLAGKAIANEE